MTTFSQLAERIDVVDKKVDRLTKNLRDVIFLLISLLVTVIGAVIIAFLTRGI